MTHGDIRSRVVAVASGKGGVGKSTVVASLSLAFSGLGYKTLVIDGDMGLANLDLIFGVKPDLNLLDVFDGTSSVEEILCQVGEKVTLLPGCSGRYDIANLDDQQRADLFGPVESLSRSYDMILVDTGAGLGSNATGFAGAAETIVLITDPDPAAIADVYSFIKILAKKHEIKNVYLIPNRVSGARDAEEVFAKVSELAGRFLGVGVHLLGYINKDPSVAQATRRRKPFLESDPASLASQRLVSIARKIHSLPADLGVGDSKELFWQKLVGWTKEGGDDVSSE